jgi:hypothetical protein
MNPAPAKELPGWTALYNSKSDWAEVLPGGGYTTPPPPDRPPTVSQRDFYKAGFFRVPLEEGQDSSEQVLLCCEVNPKTNAQCLARIAQGNDAANMVTHLARVHPWKLARIDRTGRWIHPLTLREERVSRH